MKPDWLTIHWWNDIYVINNASSSAPFEWVRPDGTSSKLNPDEKCRYLDLYQSDNTAKRSPNGNWVVTGQCSNGDTWLYWANSDGTQIKRLLDSPIPITNTHLSPISWSPDDKFMVFAANWSDESDLYVLDVSEALNDPSIQPVKISKSFSPSWQPVVAENIVKEIPTPQPTSTSSPGSLLAFTSDQNGNLDIYTMHADGTGLTNITDDPASDSNPIWSPDGKHIAFESDRDGFIQIYLMDSDGSNLIQLTNDKADHELNLNLDRKYNPWSPDGSKLLFLQSSSGGEIWNLYVMGIDGENKLLLANGRFSFNGVSWSPDGKHIGYVLNESPNPQETFSPGIYVVDTDGNNPRELKKYVPQNESLGVPYYWSSDGQSIIFVTSKDNGQHQTVYEFNLRTDTLLQKETLKPGVMDWQNDVSLIWDKDFVWQYSDGTSNTLAWNNSSCLVDVTRSSHGNFAIGAYCPDRQNFKLYWTNSDGSTIKQILDSSKSTFIGELGDIVWSWDDQYVAFTITSAKTSLYILNVEDALKDLSIEPEQVVIGGHELLYAIPSWQPQP